MKDRKERKAMVNKPFPSRKEVLALRKQYDAGTIIELISISNHVSF